MSDNLLKEKEGKKWKTCENNLNKSNVLCSVCQIFKLAKDILNPQNETAS